jgi:hypothetical protein
MHFSPLTGAVRGGGWQWLFLSPSRRFVYGFEALIRVNSLNTHSHEMLTVTLTLFVHLILHLFHAFT